MSSSSSRLYKKENVDDRIPSASKMAGAVANPRGPRQVLSSVNGGQNLVSARIEQEAGSSDGRNGPGTEFSSREDVESLLAEKMKGKTKNDYKGKSELMMEYIKKLRACVRWFMELEDGYLAELEKIRNMYDYEEKRHGEIETQMKGKIDELDARVKELLTRSNLLEENLRKEEEDKLGAVKCYKEEKKMRIVTENELSALSQELEIVKQEAQRFSDQLKMVQDTNRRLQDYNASLQQYNSTLQADAVKHNETMSKMQKEKASIMESLTNLREHSNSLKSQLESSRSSQQEALKLKEELKKDVTCLRSELHQVRDERDHLLGQVQNLTVEAANYKELYERSSKELEDFTAKNIVLEETCSSQSELILSLQQELAASNDMLKYSDFKAIEVKSEFEEQKKTIKDLQERLADAEFQIFEAEKLRRKLHNTILELKGNIRVFCRVRPLLLPECDLNGGDGSVVSYPTSLESNGRAIDLTHNGKKYCFTFDKVFNHEACQEDVFVEISQLVQSALDGYKVCIFAYGQTGSGKTYTMMGNPEPVDQKGLIPRSLEQIFQTSQFLQSQGWEYKMQASMLEIYNETIRDLLSPGRSTNAESSPALGKQYAIKHDANGTHVSDLTVIDVCSIREVSYLLEQAAQSRSVSKTQMNEQSSRSHCVFTLRIFGVNESTDQQVQGVLNLIDLAGSERLAKSGSTGDRLKETQAINKSLSALSDVIFSIAKKDDHVPFRNSKLTYLLQPCLGGDSKTLMFVNISPEVSSSSESICSLRFAARVNSCEIGIPRRQTQTRSDSRLSYG